MDTFRFRGKHCCIYGTDQNSMVPTNLVHIVVGLGGGMWDRKKSKKHWTNQKSNIPASLGTKHFFQRSTRTKMTAMAKAIDSKSRWTQFYWNIDSNQGIWKNICFYHSVSTNSLQDIRMSSAATGAQLFHSVAFFSPTSPAEGLTGWLVRWLLAG